MSSQTGWQMFLTTFVTIFLAELGDKTQFAAVAAGADAKTTTATFHIWLAVVLALGLAGTLGVFGGRLIGTLLNPEAMRWISGSLFVLVGAWILFGKR
jgi:putative Ca2+/H+ antiporter (TMEM165/GDT1 family)